MRVAFLIAAAGVLATCTAGPPEGNGADTTQVALRSGHEQAVAADVAAIVEGMAAAQGRARIVRLLRWVTP